MLVMGGVALFMGVVLFMGGWHIPRGVDFGPYLVEGQYGGVVSMGGGSAKPKVLLLTKPLELQYYFAPFSKTAK